MRTESKKLAVQDTAVDSKVVETLLINGDLAQLTPQQRVDFYWSICESLGLNWKTQPFAYIRLNGKLTLYCQKSATDQLRKLHGISVRILERKIENEIYMVTATAKDKLGRYDEDVGAVNIRGLNGDKLANALMKAETKAKRRVTLAICGLAKIDESEVETIKGAVVFDPSLELDSYSPAGVSQLEKETPKTTKPKPKQKEVEVEIEEPKEVIEVEPEVIEEDAAIDDGNYGEKLSSYLAQSGKSQGELSQFLGIPFKDLLGVQFGKIKPFGIEINEQIAYFLQNGEATKDEIFFSLSTLAGGN